MLCLLINPKRRVYPGISESIIRFIDDLSKSQQYLSTVETSKHSLMLVLQLTLMNFMNIYNGLDAVNGQRYYSLMTMTIKYF